MNQLHNSGRYLRTGIEVLETTLRLGGLIRFDGDVFVLLNEVNQLVGRGYSMEELTNSCDELRE